MPGKWSLKFVKGMLLNGDPVGFVYFWGGLQEKEAQFFLGGCDLCKNYGMMVILLSFCSYDNLALKLHQKRRSYQAEGWLFIDRFKAGNVPGMSVALVVSKKV